MTFPHVRPRRLRSTVAVRRLVAETTLTPDDLVLPLFVKEGLTEPAAIPSMPGVQQHTMESLKAAVDGAAAAGLSGVMLFGIPAAKDGCGSAGDDPDGVLNVATQAVRAQVGDDVAVMTDCCLDEFTDHGHCGVLGEAGQVDNDATLVRYAQLAISQAQAGAHVVGLSGMMDGQVGYVRAELDAAGFADTILLAYSAKYASAFYGPFRDAVDSSLTGDRCAYQQSPANRVEARREAMLDVAEGADIVMVKPSLGYLDILSDVRHAVAVPVWAYQVSGEFSMVEAAAERGWIDRERAMMESVLSIKRAGADAILTYWAGELAGLLRQGT